MQLGTKLRVLRKKGQYTLADVREKTGLSVSFLSDVERNRTSPSLESLEKLANFYNTKLGDLLSGIDPENSDVIGRPIGFDEFLREVENIDEEVTELMLLIERRASSRPESKEDWKKLYYSLIAILGR